MGLCKISKEKQFIQNLINKIISVIDSCSIISKPTPQPSKIMGSGLEYKTEAQKTDVVTLSADGFILYLYATAYEEVYPDNPSPIQRQRLHEIYRTLQVPIPPGV